MRKTLTRLFSLALLASLALTGCTPAVPGTSGTEETGETAASATTEAQKTTEEAPKREIKNILMVGNSFCYYYVEELYGIASAAGYDLTVANLYESGCRVDEHWSWLQSKSENYSLFVTDRTGRNKTTIKTINAALTYKDWDVITLQQHFDPSVAVTYEAALATCVPHTKNLFDYFRQNHPNAELYWHQTWAYQVGYKGPATAANKANDFINVPAEKKVLTVEKQTTNYENIKKVAQTLCKENNVPNIPCGDAWQLARADARIGDVLCNKDNAGNTDNYHDGAVGGGQYLNACVFFEVIMQKSCIGNTWRPSDYTLTEDQITALQNAAHQAVAAVHGADFAK